MLRKYFLNFWFWWYGVQYQSIIQSIYTFWSLSLANLNILPMAANLFVPMYQDKSLIGKFMSFFLRLFWIFGGSLMQLLITIPLLGIIILWLVLPLIFAVQFVKIFI